MGWRTLHLAGYLIACWSALLRLNLLGGIALEANSHNEVELRFQPLDVLLALDDQVLEELSRTDIAQLKAKRNPVFERGQGTCFQVQIPLQEVLEVLTNMHRERLVQHWHALQEEDAVDQPLGVAHFPERF